MAYGRVGIVKPYNYIRRNDKGIGGTEVFGTEEVEIITWADFDVSRDGKIWFSLAWTPVHYE